MLVVCAALGAALVGGVLFAFSNFVMRALARLPAAQGIAAMQAVHVTVLNPLFLGVFLGTGVLGLVALGVGLIGTTDAAAVTPVALGCALYGFGCIGVTGTRSVPWNERLASVDPVVEASADLWASYLRHWTRWNHLRVAACFAAAAAFLRVAAGL